MISRQQVRQKGERMELGNRKMNIVCDMEKCAGCMACVDICPQNAIQVLQGLRYYQAVIDRKSVV